MYRSFAVSIYICEMLFSTCTDHISIMSPISETQDYDYLYHVKGAVKIWSFKDDICRIESKKAIICACIF